MSYLLSICALLVIPAGLLGLGLRRRVNWPAFMAALPIISVIGVAWSVVVTANEWWSFSGGYVTGLRISRYLLVEELVFYPAGGALCTLLYIAGGNTPSRPVTRWYLTYLIAGTALFSAVACLHAQHRPMYLYSQLLVYNFLVCGGLARAAAQRIDFRGLVTSTSVMSALGYAWDHVAFTSGWWEYHAVTGVRVGAVPIDDWAFFLYAPSAAITIYESAVWLLSTPGSASAPSRERTRATSPAPRATASALSPLTRRLGAPGN